jgi:hypothetical protein
MAKTLPLQSSARGGLKCKTTPPGSRERTSIRGPSCAKLFAKARLSVVSPSIKYETPRIMASWLPGSFAAGGNGKPSHLQAIEVRAGHELATSIGAAAWPLALRSPVRRLFTPSVKSLIN